MPMIIIFCLLVLFLILTLIINFYVMFRYKRKIIDVNEAKKLKDIDCILVLGAQVFGKQPGRMLKHRLRKGLELYNNGVTKKIIVSGDHGRVNYDEVNVMKKYLIKKGIPSENIFMDHAGFSTYESAYRAKNIFKVKKLIIVTQKYHLYRAIYIANKLGMDAYGVSSDKFKYKKQLKREVREVFARNKDFFTCIFKPHTKFEGKEIPISGNGDLTND